MRATYNIPEPTLKPPHGKTKSRSLTAVRQQRATGFEMTDITRQSLIGNGMHSPSSATALQCATSILLIGNEFRLQSAAFQRIFAHARAANRDAVSVIEYPSRNAKNPNWRPK